MVEIQCLTCAAKIVMKTEPIIGQRIQCENCYAVSEVVWLYPLTLDYLEAEPSGSALHNPDDYQRDTW